MRYKLTVEELGELKEAFSDLLNYDSDDPSDPIDPLTYRLPDGDNCLHIAAQRGNYRAAELLLKAGVNVNQIGDMGSTALHYAKRKGFDDLVKLLLEHGASMEIKDLFGKTALDQ